VGPRTEEVAGMTTRAVERPATVDLPGVTTTPLRFNTGQALVPPEEALRDAQNFVKDLTSADKITFAGCALVILVSFFPWKETRDDGEVLGFACSGIFAFLAALATIGAVVIRERRVMPRLSRLAPWIAQLVSTSFLILWCLIFIRLSWDGRLVPSPIGNYEVALSKPSFGVVLGLMGGIGALAGTLLGLRDHE